MNADSKLRSIRLHTGHTLDTCETGRTDARGQSYIGYLFRAPDGTVIFQGEDFAGSPLHADDSDATLLSLLGFLTLRPGDTDREYFDRYTETQMDFARSSVCEAIACELSLAEEEQAAGALWTDTGY